MEWTTYFAQVGTKLKDINVKGAKLEAILDLRMLWGLRDMSLGHIFH